MPVRQFEFNLDTSVSISVTHPAGAVLVAWKPQKLIITQMSWGRSWSLITLVSRSVCLLTKCSRQCVGK